MSRRRALLAIISAATIGLVLSVATVSAAHGSKILKFDAMTGLPSALTGTQSADPLRGVAGGGLPWTLKSARGELSASGHLEIKVRGLVLADGPNAGTNPIASFRGLVSCVRADGTFDNVLTDAFPATTGPAASGGGNATIKADVVLPSPCLAPIIFVTSPTGAWFAVTGA
jgi:hypothetical protein